MTVMEIYLILLWQQMSQYLDLLPEDKNDLAIVIHSEVVILGKQQLNLSRQAFFSATLG